MRNEKKQETNHSSDTEEFKRFTTLTDALLSVPHVEIQKAVEKHKKEAAKNPHKRGPKPRSKKNER